MSNVPTELKYTRSHEWLRRNEDGTVTVGITDHAQEQLGDMVYVEIPEVGQALAANDACAVVESVKAASDVYAPVDGEVVEVNDSLTDNPEAINQDAFGKGWIMKLKPSDAAQIDTLLDAAGYEAFVASEE
jgi:glycine cleavage system H protein